MKLQLGHINKIKDLQFGNNDKVLKDLQPSHMEDLQQ